MNIQNRYVQVNIGQGDLGENEWHAFLGVVTGAIVNATRNAELMDIELHRGIGYWDDAVTGVRIAEKSAHLSTIADVDLFALRTALGSIKREFRQDAIAVIVGSDLV